MSDVSKAFPRVLIWEQWTQVVSFRRAMYEDKPQEVEKFRVGHTLGFTIWSLASWTEVRVWLVDSWEQWFRVQNTESSSLEVGPSNLGFNKPSRWIWRRCKLDNRWCGRQERVLPRKVFWRALCRDRFRELWKPIPEFQATSLWSFPQISHFAGVAKVRSLHSEHTIVENACVRSCQSESKQHWDDGFDFEDLLKRGSPGFLGAHLGNCFAQRAIRMQLYWLLVWQNLRSYSQCNF